MGGLFKSKLGVLASNCGDDEFQLIETAFSDFRKILLNEYLLSPTDKNPMTAKIRYPEMGEALVPLSMAAVPLVRGMNNVISRPWILGEEIIESFIILMNLSFIT